ncbi:hypothetical protein P3S67_004774 [Capsicum chacoense]
MESPLEPVRDKRTGAVLFYRKIHPPFKTTPRPKAAPKNNSADVLAAKNVSMIGNFRKAAADAGVLLNFGNDYGFWDNFRELEKTYHSHSHKERSKELEKIALISGPKAIVKEVKNLSRDVHNLSSTKDMLNQFTEQNLFD